jgi:hypothetical protein
MRRLRRWPSVADLAPLPMQYADYAVWQRGWLADGRAAAAARLLDGAAVRGCRQGSSLPTDRPRGLAVPSYPRRGAPLHDRCGAARRTLMPGAREATLFMVLLAAYQRAAVALERSGRGGGRLADAGPHAPRAEGLIGFFVNNLALRTDLSGDPTFRELVGGCGRPRWRLWASGSAVRAAGGGAAAGSRSGAPPDCSR